MFLRNESGGKLARVEARAASWGELADMRPPVRLAYEEGQLIVKMPDGVCLMSHDKMIVPFGAEFLKKDGKK